MSEHHACQTSVQNLSLTLDGIPILKNISINLFCHQLCALIGPNGAGKSSLLRCLTGEIKGDAHVYFKHTKKNPRIGYVPQKLIFEKDSPMTALDLFFLAHSRKPIWLPQHSNQKKLFYQALATVKAAHLCNRKIATLSGGEQRRIVLALALCGNPELLLLDEPDSGVDAKGLVLFYDILSELKKNKNYDVSILMVSHDFKLLAKHADRVLLLDEGHLICQGRPDEVFSSPEFGHLFD
ncbi:MAG: metal ABC transporter ATP-binding protein [Spirochaetia bacterium]